MPFIPYNSAGGLTTQAGTGNHEHTYQQMGTRNASGTDFVGGVMVAITTQHQPQAQERTLTQLLVIPLTSRHTLTHSQQLA